MLKLKYQTHNLEPVFNIVVWEVGSIRPKHQNSAQRRHNKCRRSLHWGDGKGEVDGLNWLPWFYQSPTRAVVDPWLVLSGPVEDSVDGCPGQNGPVDASMLRIVVGQPGVAQHWVRDDLNDLHPRHWLHLNVPLHNGQLLWTETNKKIWPPPLKNTT